MLRSWLPLSAVMLRELPKFDRADYDAATCSRAGRVWASLRSQEERSRLAATRMLSAFARLGAPEDILASGARVLEDEARHVALCDEVLSALGYEPPPLRVDLPALPASTSDLARALTTFIVAGFAVAETMSVGGFVAARKAARAPIARAALGQLARDEVGHGAFGERAGQWLMRGWSVERRRGLWPDCVAVMEDMERKAGGPIVVEPRADAAAALGAVPPQVIALGFLQSVPRAVLPRLARLGVLPMAPCP